MEETIAKQNKKLDDLFNKLSEDKIDITKTNPPMKNICEEKNSLRGSNERKQTKERKNCKEIRRSTYSR